MLALIVAIGPSTGSSSSGGIMKLPIALMRSRCRSNDPAAVPPWFFSYAKAATFISHLEQSRRRRHAGVGVVNGFAFGGRFSVKHGEQSRYFLIKSVH